MSRTQQELEQIREEYTLKELHRDSVDPNPIDQFQEWFDEAMDSELRMPNAMTVATSNTEGQPSSRIMLLKGIKQGQFLFYTNYNSRKAKDLEENPYAALTFFWELLERQVRIEGKVSRVSREQSVEYFQSRPRGSQLGAWASPQDDTIKSRQELEESYEHYGKKFKDQDIPCPDDWGGYQLAPHQFEFWQGRPNRLHDRILYTRNGDNKWEIKRLAP